MEKKQYEDYVEDNKLDLSLLTKDLNSLTIRERTKLFKEMKDLVNKYLKMDLKVSCANSGHNFGNWIKKDEYNSNGLEDGLSSEDKFISKYYRVCDICGYEEAVYNEPAEYKNQEIERKIQFHNAEIEKLQKQKIKK